MAPVAAAAAAIVKRDLRKLLKEELAAIKSSSLQAERQQPQPEDMQEMVHLLVNEATEKIAKQQQPPPQKRRDSSKDASVLAMAQGYDLKVHQRFVGSLRKSGFEGTMYVTFLRSVFLSLCHSCSRILSAHHLSPKTASWPPNQI